MTTAEQKLVANVRVSLNEPTLESMRHFVTETLRRYDLEVVGLASEYHFRSSDPLPEKILETALQDIIRYCDSDGDRHVHEDIAAKALQKYNRVKNGWDEIEVVTPVNDSKRWKMTRRGMKRV